MKTTKIYSKEEINKIMRNIDRKHEKGHKKEQFRQVYLPTSDYKNIDNDGEFLPFIVSSYGRIFSINYKKKRNCIHELKLNNVKGYLVTPINFNGKKRQVKVHRMVAIAFIKNYDIINKQKVNHKNGIKTDNYYWNLEWCTTKENIRHAHKTGLANYKGENNPENKYTNDQIIKVYFMLENNYSMNDIVSKTKVSYMTVSKILNKCNWTHISKDYNFDNYNYGKCDDYYNTIRKICELGELENITISDISKITGVNRYNIHDILYGRTHKNISSQYNLLKFKDRSIINNK